MHASGIFRGENACTPRLQLFGRHATEVSGDIQRPTEMLSRMTQTDTHAVVRADLVIEAADEGKLLRQRGRLLGDAALQLPADLAGQPWPTLRAAADHHG